MKSTSVFALCSLLALTTIYSCKKNDAGFVQTSPANGGSNIGSSTTLSCTTVSGAISYIFTLTDGSDSIVKTVSTDTVSVSHLSPCDTYTWAVTAKMADGSSVTTAPSWTFTTAPQSNVACLSFPGTGSTGVCLTPTFNWTAIPGVSSYYLSISTSPASLYGGGIFVSGNSYTINTSSLSPGTQYYWCVSGYPSLPYSETYTFTTVGGPVLQSPANLTTASTRTPSFSWSSNSCTSNYTFDISTVNNFTSNTQSTQVSGSSFSITSPLTAYTTYYWRVRVNDYTATSSTFSFTTGL